MANLVSKLYRFKAGFGQEEILRMREDVSRQMYEAGVAGQTTYALVNVLDEFCCNVMEHGKAGWVEIQVSPLAGGVSAVIRDNGVEFDPTASIKSVDPDTPAHVSERRLGLYMVGLLAQDLAYLREEGVNRLEFRMKS